MINNLLKKMQFNDALILSTAGFVMTAYYSWHSKRIANHQMMKDLFTEFNQRYDCLNEDLELIHKHYGSLEDLKKSEHFDHYRSVVIDFFNLCAEEYYWYRKGRIDKNVWRSWHVGMNSWYRSSKVIEDLWKNEVDNGFLESYYITRADQFFHT